MTIPRRCDLLRSTPAELAIRAAVDAVESAGCHPLLTEAVNLLDAAREKVADFVDAQTVAAVGKPWWGNCVVMPKSESEWWVRYCDKSGIYWWLHPEGRWVGEPDQINMPLYDNKTEATAAMSKAPDPPESNLYAYGDQLKG